MKLEYMSQENWKTRFIEMYNDSPQISYNIYI